MDMRRAGMVFVAAAALVILLAAGAFAQTSPAAGTCAAATAPISTASAGEQMGTTTAMANVMVAPVAPPIMDYASASNSGGPVQHFAGRIVAIEQFYPAGPGGAPGTEVFLDLPPGIAESIPDWQLAERPRLYRVVQLGPSWYVQQNLRLHIGDLVAVSAYPVLWHGDRVYIARRVGVGERRLALRGWEGSPMWAGGWGNWGQTSAMAMAPAPTTEAQASPGMESESASAGTNLATPMEEPGSGVPNGMSNQPNAGGPTPGPQADTGIENY